MAIKRIDNQTNEEKLTVEINNGDNQALKAIKEKFNFSDEESALRFALAVLKQSKSDTIYIDDVAGNRVGLQPSDSLRKKPHAEAE